MVPDLFSTNDLSFDVRCKMNSAVMYLYAKLSRKDTKVIHILGSMITGTTNKNEEGKGKKLTAGSLGHLGVGLLFALMYFLFWNWGVFEVSWIDSFWVGAISGTIAIIVWRLYFALHLHPPKISFVHYFIALFIAHIVFGITTVNIFRLITDSPEFWYQLNKKVSEGASAMLLV